MADSFWHVVRDEQYRKETGETARREREQEEERRRADEKMREAMGNDCPSPYRWR